MNAPTKTELPAHVAAAVQRILDAEARRRLLAKENAA